MTTIVVANSEEFRKALISAKGGETILLKASDEKYKIEIWHSTQRPDRDTITITSEDPDNPAVIDQVRLTGLTDLHFTGVKVAGEKRTGHNVADLHFTNAKDITITDVEFENRATDWGTRSSEETMAIWVTGSENIHIEDSTFKHYMRGIAHRNNDNISIINNDFQLIQEDGIRGGGANGLTITGNHFHNWLGFDNGTLHADFIQIWSHSTNRRTEDVLIADNIFQGEGGNTAKQVIFARNDAVDMHGGDLETYEFRNWTITNNIIDMPTSQSIKLAFISGLEVSNNTLTFPGGIDIRWAKDAEIANNIAHNVHGKNNASDVVFTNNVTMQARDPGLEDLQTYIYSNLERFRETGDVAQLLIREGSIGDTGTPVGADIFSFLTDDGLFYVIDAEPFSFATPLDVVMKLRAFTADGTEVDLSGQTVTWAMGDGTTLTGAEINYSYALRDTYAITVSVDGEGIVSGASLAIPAEDLLVLDVSQDGAVDLQGGEIKLGNPDVNIKTDPDTGKSVLHVKQGAAIYADPLQSTVNMPMLSLEFTYQRTDADGPHGAFLNISQYFELRLRENGELHLALTEPGAGKKNIFVRVDTGNTDWHHVALTFDPTTDQVAKLYFDGVLVGEMPMTWNMPTGGDRDFVFGAPRNNSIDALIGDLNITSSVWTAQEVAESYVALISDAVLPDIIDDGDDSNDSGSDDDTSDDPTDGSTDDDTSDLFQVNNVLLAYDAQSSQNGGDFQVLEGGATLEQSTNAWTEISLGNQTVTEGMTLSFDFSSTDEGEIHGFALASGGKIVNEYMFVLAGTQAVTGAIDSYYDADYSFDGSAQSYQIDLSDHLMGVDFNRLVFFTDDDAKAGSNSTWANVTLTEATFGSGTGGSTTGGTGGTSGGGFLAGSGPGEGDGGDDNSDDRSAGNGDDGGYTGADYLIINGEALTFGDQASQNGGSSQAVNLGKTLEQGTNAWTEIFLGDHAVAEGMTLSFDFSSTDEGEIHGFALASGGKIANEHIFTLAGTQNVSGAIKAYDDQGVAFDGTVQSYQIDLSDHLMGVAFDRLVFLTDDDAMAGSNSTWSNIELSDATLDAVSLGNVNASTDHLLINDTAYTFGDQASQNGGSYEVVNLGKTLEQGTNAWTEIFLGDHAVADGMTLSFDFSSTDEGEIHGVALASGGKIANEHIFALAGTQNVSGAIKAYDDQGVAFDGTVQSYQIDLSDHLMGVEFDRLVFLTDDDAMAGSNSTWSHIELSHLDIA